MNWIKSLTRNNSEHVVIYKIQTNKANQADALRFVIVFAKNKSQQKQRQTYALLFAALGFNSSREI